LLPGFAKFVVIKKPATKERAGINPFTKEPTVFKAKPARKKGQTAHVNDRTGVDWPGGLPNQCSDRSRMGLLFCTLPDELQVAGMRELGRVVKSGGIIRCLEYTRPSGGLRRAMTRLWEPWVYWAYGAGFDRND